MDFAALQHSVFLQALGSAILNSLWQCFILWFVYETISASYKEASARFKNNLATVLLFFSFAWFLTSFISKIFHAHQVTSGAAVAAGFSLQPHTTHAASGLGEFLSYASASLPYLSVAYIFLLFFLIYRLFAAYRYVYFISSKRLMSPTGDLQLFASGVATKIGITKKIGVWISHHIDVPATIGFFKPVILIPVASINNLSGQQLEAIILHELAHIRRNDYVTNLVISVIETILFFNPFVVLLSNIIKRERENCCDDFVLQYRYDPHSYASALLRLEQSRMSKLKLAIGAVSGKKQLLSRIKRITNSQVTSRQFNYGQKIMALLLVTTIICSVAWLSPEEKKSAFQKPLVKSTPAPLSRPKPVISVRPLAEAVIASKPIENLPPINVKHLTPKNTPVTPPAPADIESENENLSVNASADEDDENKDEANFPAGANINLPDVAGVKQPDFSFDLKDLKLPQLPEIQNFLVQNMNLNIDFSKMDMEKLNKNLKLAYKEIHALDWNKVQNDIRRSFEKMKPGKLPQKDPEVISRERANVLSQQNLLRAQRVEAQAYLEELRNQTLAAHDSMHIVAMAAATEDNKNKVRRVYNEVYNQLQRLYKGDKNKSDSRYYYNYSNTTRVRENNNDDEKPCTQQKNSTNQDKKTVQISIRRITNDRISHTGLLNEKKGFRFSFSKDDDEQPNHESVISVEVNN